MLWRLPPARSGLDRRGETAAGQVWPAQTALSGRESPGAVHEIDAQRKADGASSGDRADRTEPPRKPDEPAVDAIERDGGTESTGSVSLGAADERTASAG